MPYVEPPDRATALFVTAAIWNQDLAENLRSLFPDGATVDSWTPLIESDGTDPTTSSNVGRQFQVGGMMNFWGRFVIATAGSGNYYTDLPAASVGITSSGSAGAGSHVGGWHARDASTGDTMAGSLQLTTQLSTDAVFFVVAEPGVQRLVTAAVPWAWEVGDVLTFSGSYPVA